MNSISESLSSRVTPVEENGQKRESPVIETKVKGDLLGDRYKVTDAISKETLHISEKATKPADVFDIVFKGSPDGIESYCERTAFAKEAIQVTARPWGATISLYKTLDKVIEKSEQKTLKKAQNVKQHHFDFAYSRKDLLQAIDYLESFTVSWLLKDESRGRTVCNREEMPRPIKEPAAIFNELEELRSFAALSPKKAKKSYLNQSRDVQGHVSELFTLMGPLEKKGSIETLKTAFKTLEVFHNRWFN